MFPGMHGGTDIDRPASLAAETLAKAETAGWPRELAQGLAGALEPLLVPIAGEDALELSPEFKRQLQAIGYGSGAGH